MVSVWAKQHEIMIYTDDALVFVSKPEVNIPKLLTMNNNFELIKVNWSKSEILGNTKYAYKELP